MPPGKCGETMALKLTFAEFGCQGAISGRVTSYESDPLWSVNAHLIAVITLRKLGQHGKQAERVIDRTFRNVA